jgi:hypothetical protein
VKSPTADNLPALFGDHELLDCFVQDHGVFAQQDSLAHKRLDERLD